MTWKEIIRDALEHLGGEAPLREIYEYIQCTSPGRARNNWQATVRGTLERNSSDSAAFEGKTDLFYSANGLGAGVWGLRDFVPSPETMDLTQDDAAFAEGRPRLRQHILRERNHRVITRAKEEYLKTHGRLRCEVCGFDFEAHYGAIGRGFIEGHHLKPVSQLEPGEKTRVEDIVLLCSNCHSMIHRKKPWITKEELISLIQDAQSS